MKHLWFIIGVLIISILIHPLTFLDQASPIPRNHNTIKYTFTDKYIHDWSIKNDSIDSSDKSIYTIIEPGQARNSDLNNNRLGETKNGPMDSPWPMLSHDIQHFGRSAYSTQNNSGAEIWYVKGDWAGVVWSSAVIDNNNIIYYGTLGEQLFALYPNGTRKWSYHATGLIWCTPALADDGTIYFTNWGGHYFHALTPNGTIKWLYAQGGSSTSSPSIAEDGTIYFGDNDYIIYALNPYGTEKWRYMTGDIVMGSPAIADDGTIYVGSLDRYLYALYPNGTLRWRFHTGGEIKGSASVAPDGTIYIPSFDGFLYALYPNGTMKWQASTGGSVAGAGVALAEDGTIYIGTEQLRAFYPNNGTLKWMTNVQGSIYGTVPAVSADGTIYVSAGGSLVAVNPDGTERWRKQLTIAQIHSSPSIGPEDRVYVGSEDYGAMAYGYLHAFGLLDPNAPAAPTITGQTNGKIKRTYDYTFTSTSPLGKQIYYLIDWGDGATMDWLGPYNSSEPLTMEHSWSEQGTYNITARAKDTNNRWGPWGELQVTMPKTKDLFTNQTLLNWLFERFPHAFPILRYILNHYSLSIEN